LARLLFRRNRRETGRRFISFGSNYDGAIATNNATFAQTRQDFGALSGTRQSTELMEKYLASERFRRRDLRTHAKAKPGRLDRRHLALGDGGVKEIPSR